MNTLDRRKKIAYNNAYAIGGVTFPVTNPLGMGTDSSVLRMNPVMRD